MNHFSLRVPKLIYSPVNNNKPWRSGLGCPETHGALEELPSLFFRVQVLLRDNLASVHG